MPTFRIVTQEVVYKTYEIEVDIAQIGDGDLDYEVETIFAGMSEQEQKDSLVDTDEGCYDIDTIEQID